jgi:hypothetical protein
MLCVRRAPVTALNLAGYSVAFAAVCWYNYTKLQSMKQAQAGSQKVISISANAKVGKVGPTWLQTALAFTGTAAQSKPAFA